jgi:hypothetical protein
VLRFAGSVRFGIMACAPRILKEAPTPAKGFRRENALLCSTQAAPQTRRYFVALLIHHQVSEEDLIGLPLRRQHLRSLAVSLFEQFEVFQNNPLDKPEKAIAVLSRPKNPDLFGEKGRRHRAISISGPPQGGLQRDADFGQMTLSDLTARPMDEGNKTRFKLQQPLEVQKRQRVRQYNAHMGIFGSRGCL